MNEAESRAFEEELSRLRPAAPPREFLTRLATPPAAPAAGPAGKAIGSASRAAGIQLADWRLVFRWLTPAAALAAALVLVWLRPEPTGRTPSPPLARSVAPALKADSVQLDEHLLGSFDAVGRLPGGEPVRFRCREWLDRLQVSDKATGLLIEQSTPRVEVVPVRFETY